MVQATRHGGLALPLLALVGAASASANATCELGVSNETALPLNIEDINPHVKAAQYAVRGRLLDRAGQLEAQLREGVQLPFERIVKCNIGNPQALGQKPLSFVRRTLSLLLNPELLNESLSSYPADVVERARAYKGAVPSVGAYSDSQGVTLVREHVAEFISERDGHPAARLLRRALRLCGEHRL